MKFFKSINPQLAETEIHVKTYDEMAFDAVKSRFERLIKLETTEGLRMIKGSEIIYVESLRNYQEIHLADLSVLRVRSPLYRLKLQLGAEFAQVARSYLINIQLLTRVENDLVNGLVARVSGHKIPISQRFLPELNEKLDTQEEIL